MGDIAQKVQEIHRGKVFILDSFTKNEEMPNHLLHLTAEAVPL